MKARARRGKKSKVNKDPRVIKMCYLEVFRILRIRGISHQGYNINPFFSGSKMSPNPRVINLHVTSYIQYPEPLSRV